MFAREISATNYYGIAAYWHYCVHSRTYPNPEFKGQRAAAAIAADEVNDEDGQGQDPGRDVHSEEKAAVRKVRVAQVTCDARLRVDVGGDKGRHA